MLFSIIIPTYNGRKLLAECLNSLKNQSLKPDEIIIVDNGSTDSTVKFYSRKGVKYIRLDRNYGFSKACNVGVRESKSIYVGILNNDAIPDRDWLKSIYKVIKIYPRISAFIPKVVTFKDPNIIDNVGDIVTPNWQVIHRGYGEVNSRSRYSRIEEVSLVSATAVIYKRNFFDKVGYFDEDFESYFEDVDISLRGQLMGHKYLYVPNALVTHKGKETSRLFEAKRGFLEVRNSILVWLINLPDSIIFNRKVFLKLIIFYLKLTFTNFRIGKSILMIKVIVNLLMIRKLVLIKRINVQSKIIVPIRYLATFLPIGNL